MELPKLPKKTSWGAYDTVSLARYFTDAANVKMSEVQMAQHLRVPLHRILYFQHKEVQALLYRRVEQLLNA